MLDCSISFVKCVVVSLNLIIMQLKEEGLLVLKGLDSKLSKNLPPDLQKLRCKVRDR